MLKEKVPISITKASVFIRKHITYIQMYLYISRTYSQWLHAEMQNTIINTNVSQQTVTPTSKTVTSGRPTNEEVKHLQITLARLQPEDVLLGCISQTTD